MKAVNFSKIRQAHFFGIGGIGVSAVARMFISEGKMVSGSDFSDSDIVQELRGLGVVITIGQNIEDIPAGTGLVVYSTAIEVADPEFLKKLKSLPLTVISYAEALAIISADKFTIAVSGTHGKTTTTAMIGKILIDAGLAPSMIVGSLINADKPGRRTNFVAGRSNYLVVEVDEYQRKFLGINPQILVITNIDEDHLDYFRDLADIQAAFAALAGKVPPEGAIVTSIAHPNISPVLAAARAPVLDYATAAIDGLRLKFPGEHNRANARAALTAAAFLGVPLSSAVTALNDFSGTWRRFEYLGKTKNGALVYDDYAHNPQKVAALLSGAREMFPKRKIVAVFQPHLYSRTKTLFEGFVRSFADADEVLLLPIFAARETFDPSVTSEHLAEAISKDYKNKKVATFKSFEETAASLREASENTIILTIGAGDIYRLAGSLINTL